MMQIAMCQDEGVETVKALIAELCLEKDRLVERLNAMHERIEEERNLATKVLLKVEWMEEKERSLELLHKVHSLSQALFQGLLTTNLPGPFSRRCLLRFEVC
jgi:hypothetical protein